MNTRKIIYLGDDPEIIANGQAFFKKRSTLELQFVFKISGIESLSDCSLILIDFTHPTFNADLVLKQIDLLKHHDVYREIVIAGLFKDKEEMIKNIHFFHYGLNYTFIKGNDISLFFEDTFYVTFDLNPGFPLFARAKNLDLKYTGSLPSFISAINESSVKINTDIELNALLPVSHTLLGEKKIHEFPIEETQLCQETGNSLLSNVASIPYPGPWEQISSDAILRDTIETLLGQENRFIRMKGNCLVHEAKGSLFYEMLTSSIEFPLQIHFKTNDPDQTIKELKPEVIILGNEDVEDVEGLALSVLEVVKDQKMYEPMIIIFNSSGDSAHMRDLLRYKKILAHKNKCNVNIVSQLLLLHSQKSGMGTSDWNCFRPGDEIANVDIMLELHITGISEHAISFTSTIEIPMYTNLKFDVPVDCYLLVVPTLRNLPPNPRGEHYMGFIHGVDQEEANYLRKFVNQIIFSPITSFKRIEIKKSDETGEIVLPDNMDEQIKEEPKKVPSPPVPKRRTFKKSKL